MKTESKIKESKLVIVIDGLAASGKSTTAQLLARKLNYLYLDTGALYRALTLKVVRAGLKKGQDRQIVSLLNRTKVGLKNGNADGRVFLDSEEVTDQIRTPEVDRNVTWVCIIPQVRNRLVEIQRQYGEEGAIVAEGRDLGTVVFPEADLKFYLQASLDARATRRRRDLKGRGIELSIQSTKSELDLRDKLDSERKLSPLAKAQGAIEIDTTHLTVKEQVDLLFERVTEYLKRSEKKKPQP